MRESDKQYEYNTTTRERAASVSPESASIKKQLQVPTPSKNKNVLSAFQHIFGTSFSSEFTRPIVHHPDDPGSPLPSDDEQQEERNVHHSRDSAQRSSSASSGNGNINHLQIPSRRSRSRSNGVMEQSQHSASVQMQMVRQSRSSDDPGPADEKQRSRSRRRSRKTHYYRSQSLMTPKAMGCHQITTAAATCDEREAPHSIATAAGIPTVIHTNTGLERITCKKSPTNSVLLPHRSGGLQCLPMEVQPLTRGGGKQKHSYTHAHQPHIPPYINFSRSDHDDDAMFR
jgi:hypothetical protein